jgi:hypothetical protein
MAGKNYRLVFVLDWYAGISRLLYVDDYSQEKKVLAEYERIHNSSDRQTRIDYYRTRADEFVTQQRYDEALGCADQLVSLLETKSDTESYELLQAQLLVADLHDKRQDTEKADSLYGILLDKIKHMALLDPLHRVNLLRAVASYYTQTNKTHKSAEALQAAITTLDKTDQVFVPVSWTVMTDLAQVYAQDSKYPDAESLCWKAYRKIQKSLGENNLHQARVLAQLIRLYDAEKHYALADTLVAQVTKLLQDKFSPKKPENLDLAIAVGQHRSVMGEYAKAESLYESLLSDYEAKYGFDSPYNLPILKEMSAVYKKQGGQEKSDALDARIYKIRMLYQNKQ